MHVSSADAVAYWAGDAMITKYLKSPGMLA